MDSQIHSNERGGQPRCMKYCTGTQATNMECMSKYLQNIARTILEDEKAVVQRDMNPIHLETL